MEWFAADAGSGCLLSRYELVLRIANSIAYLQNALGERDRTIDSMNSTQFNPISRLGCVRFLKRKSHHAENSGFIRRYWDEGSMLDVTTSPSQSRIQVCGVSWSSQTNSYIPGSLLHTFIPHSRLILPSSPGRLPVKRKRAPSSSSNESLIPHRGSLRQPPHTPQTLLTLRLRRHALLPLHRPHLRLAIVASTQQELATPVPVHTHDPAPMARESRNLLTGLGVVERDDACVACRC